MKIKVLATAIGAALCSVSTLHAAGVSVDGANQLRAPGFTPEELKAYQLRIAESRSVMQRDGLNVQVNGQGPKFVEEPDVTGEQTYIVRLKSAPVAVKRAELLSEQANQQHTGQGILATGSMPAAAQTLNSVNRQKVQSYKSSILQQQSRVFSKVNNVAYGAKMRQQYSEALNGFSVTMTPSEARRVSQLGEVAFVHRAKVRELLTDAGPDVIEADQAWTGNAGTGVAVKGEGIIMGILDTGVNTDHASFAATGSDGYTVTNPWGAGTYVGDCVANAELCNDKLIGVRSYPVITRDYFYQDSSVPMNGEDYQGHGSHTASTAAGNVLKDVGLYTYSTEDNGDGELLKEALFPELSGVAPHANIISYQVCWPDSDSSLLAGCPDEAILAGIEDAIEDGVDVINYSIGGGDSAIYEDAVQMAFLAAHEAGISVSAAAGNSGQVCGSECFASLDNASPWLMNVAASTHEESVVFESRLTNPTYSDPASPTSDPGFSMLAGGAINDTSVTGVIVEAADYPNVSGVKDQYCGEEYAPGTFDVYPNGDPILDAEGNPTNTIVVCARNNLSDPNGIARTAKSDNIKAGGAEGYILWNYGSTDTVVYPAKYSLPAVHLSYDDWWGGLSNGFVGLSRWIRTYGERGHTMTINETLIDRERDPENADWLATFSSRGPSLYNREVLAPMVTAPGVDVYAAFADQHPFLDIPNNADFAFLSGTSMAAPHVAGSMALLRQMHPQWSPAEIQSALMMTADETVRYYRSNSPSNEAMETGTYRSGSGRINVQSAANSGLLMHENASNFIAANPNNGGAMEQLNVPYLADMSCQPECTWTRTVKATRDGSWSVEKNPVLNWDMDPSFVTEQNGVDINVSPSQFTLKAGEEQVITVTAKVTASQDVLSNSEVELHSQLRFVEQSGAAPDVHWPMAFMYDHGELPYRLNTTAHVNEGETRIEGINVSQATQPHARVFKPVKADIHQVTLPKDDDYIYPWDVRLDTTDPANSMDQRLDDSVATQWINVPENTKRVIVAMQKVVESPLIDKLDKANPVVYLGKDLNNDGQVQIDDELICMSNHVVIENFCNLNEPEAGDYWALIYNQRASSSYPEFVETVEYAVGVVPNEEASNVSARFDNTDPENATLLVNWNMPGMMEGDLYYSAIDVGTSVTNPGNLGMVPYTIERGVDVVSLEVGESELNEKTAAKPGETVPYTFKLLPNTSGMDRSFTLTTEIPEGLEVREEDVMFSNEGVAEVTIEDGVMTITGTQRDTSSESARYEVTTNVTDQMCRTPDLGNANPGGYIDLANFNIGPSIGSFEENGRLEYHRGTSIPLYALFGAGHDTWALYDNAKDVNHHPRALGIRGNGMIDLWGGTRAVLNNVYVMGRNYNQARETHLATELGFNSGVSLAATQSGWGVIEWDNAQSYQNFGNFRFADWQPALNDSYDFELIFNVNTRFGDNQHEMYMAYDNLDFGNTQALGMIGTIGFKGYVTTYGPLSGGLLEDWFAQGSLSAVQDDLVVCYDYVGPESSQFEFTAWVKVAAGTYGSTFDWSTLVDMDGQASSTVSHTMTVHGNLAIDPISDQVTDEDQPLSGIVVSYSDKMDTPNEISVSGEHFSAEVSGDESGAEITITPEADFSGTTEVTVTVADLENPSDIASTTFVLTVNGVNDAPVANVAAGELAIDEGDTFTLDASGSYDPDGDTLSFEWTGPGTIEEAGAATTAVTSLGEGEHTFTVTVSDGMASVSMDVMVTVTADEVVVTPEPEPNKKKGGSMAWTLLLLLALMGTTRRLYRR